MEWMKKLEIGDLVEHRVNNAKVWGLGIIKHYRKHYGLYEVVWSDGQVRTHTIELLKQIA
tara:strand:- start:2885 stop:3064 length:180 start_codon:yes stop_codon:yes gene_type:complete